MRYFLVIFFCCVSTLVHAQLGSNQTRIELSEDQKPTELKIGNNILLRAIVSKNRCVVGESILVSYKFYSKLSGNAKVVRQPTFSGCSVVEMTTNDRLPSYEHYNGKAYKVYLIREVQIKPLQEGTIVLDSATVENTFSVYDKGTKERDILAGIAKKHEVVYPISNPSVTIQVDALPEKDKPTNFEGYVGNYTMNVAVSKTTDTANETNKLTITIVGAGDISNVACPTIAWPKNIDHFDAITSTEVARLVFPTMGTKKFDIPFVATQAGTMVIPPIKLSFYDAISKVYKTVESDSIVLQIRPAIQKNYETELLKPASTNIQYIWIVPCIALVAGLGWWFRFAKKQTPTKEPVTKKELLDNSNLTDEVTKTTEVASYKQQLHRLMFTMDEETYYKKAKAMAIEALKQQSNKHLQEVITLCNNYLYAGIQQETTKSDILTLLEQALIKDQSDNAS